MKIYLLVRKHFWGQMAATPINYTLLHLRNPDSAGHTHGWGSEKWYQAVQTTDEVLRSLTKNETLIKVLAAQYGDYGLPPKQSSFVMHASVVRHYFSGGSFPVGGSSQIVETIAPVLAKTNSSAIPCLQGFRRTGQVHRKAGPSKSTDTLNGSSA